MEEDRNSRLAVSEGMKVYVRVLFVGGCFGLLDRTVQDEVVEDKDTGELCTICTWLPEHLGYSCADRSFAQAH